MTRVIDNVGKLVLVGVADIIGLGLEWVKDFNLVCGPHQAILAPTFRGGLWEDLKWTSKETNTPALYFYCKAVTGRLVCKAAEDGRTWQRGCIYIYIYNDAWINIAEKDMI